MLELEPLIAYFLACLETEATQALRMSPDQRGSQWVPVPLAWDWFSLGCPTREIVLDPADRRFSRAVWDGANRVIYGYPLMRASGQLLPLLLRRAVLTPLGGDNCRIEAIPEPPRLNQEWLKTRPGKEKRALAGVLRRADGCERMASHLLREFLREDRRNLPLVEQPEPDLPILDRERFDEEGIYNRGVMAVPQTLSYTLNVCRDLRSLAGRSTAGTALEAVLAPSSRDALAAFEPPQTAALHFQHEALNMDQQTAVQSAFERPLSVVTGPPGNGKSTVVSSIIARALVGGERVLLASRNHQALAVVEQRLKAPIGADVLVRAGVRSGDRDLRGELLARCTLALASGGSASSAPFAAAVSRYHRRRELREQLNEALRVEMERRARIADLEGSIRDLSSSLGLDLSAFQNELFAFPGPHWIIPLARQLNRGWRRPRRRWTLVLDVLALVGVRVLCAKYGALLGPHLGGDGSPVQTADRALLLAKLAQALREKRKLATVPSTLSANHLAARILVLDAELLGHAEEVLRALPERFSAATKGEVRAAVATYRAALTEAHIAGGSTSLRSREGTEAFASLLDVFPAWAETTLSVGSSVPLEPALFDLLVIDEASQCDIPSALPLLFRARRAVIIGDDKQLPHIPGLSTDDDTALRSMHGVSNPTARYTCASLFDFVTARPSAKVVVLRSHYRCHPDIVGFPNMQWYGNALQIWTDPSRLMAASVGGIRWVEVEGEPRCGIGGGVVHDSEASAAVRELRSLANAGYAGTIGVVTPFRAQAAEIRGRLAAVLGDDWIRARNLVVSTAHGFQGAERDLMVMTCCIGPRMPLGGKWFLERSERLFNVAVTRARAELIVVGNASAMLRCGIGYLEAFAAYVREIRGRHPYNDVPAGPSEAVLYRALRDAGLCPMAQYPVAGYRVDIALVSGKKQLVIEVDGDAYHRDRTGLPKSEDVLRDLRIEAAGWVLMRLGHSEVMADPGACASVIARHLSSAVTQEPATYSA